MGRFFAFPLGRECLGLAEVATSDMTDSAPYVTLVE